MEAVAYDKLRNYSKRLPQGVLDKWQPPQAVKALLELEPDADQDFELKMSPESEPGVPTGEWVNLGSHKSLKLDWLRKHYNKLGNLLHVPQPNAKASSLQLSANELRKYLESIISEMESAVASTMDASLAMVVTFRCSVCGETVAANLSGVQKTRRAVCLNPQCGAEFSAIQNQDGELSFRLVATYFKCIKCDQEIPVENRKLAMGYRFKCATCGEEHEIVERNWGYVLVSETAANTGVAADD
jgi:transcription elongation factor Elf1